ncbi:hypothetical protein AVEN_242354-1 [Araneus ventricosus]|uniref:Uncharacterized protein n=1 Tax=Araneus ventricosus TaxID=182803 RepID=A0A4Y2Q3B1_ARAVE|nr:hypothetical protein AVEN_242354-1 [Araneus ventricosus]
MSRLDAMDSNFEPVSWTWDTYDAHRTSIVLTDWDLFTSGFIDTRFYVMTSFLPTGFQNCLFEKHGICLVYITFDEDNENWLSPLAYGCYNSTYKRIGLDG